MCSRKRLQKECTHLITCFTHFLDHFRPELIGTQPPGLPVRLLRLPARLASSALARCNYFMDHCQKFNLGTPFMDDDGVVWLVDVNWLDARGGVRNWLPYKAWR